MRLAADATASASAMAFRILEEGKLEMPPGLFSDVDEEELGTLISRLVEGSARAAARGSLSRVHAAVDRTCDSDVP